MSLFVEVKICVTDRDTLRTTKWVHITAVIRTQMRPPYDPIGHTMYLIRLVRAAIEEGAQEVDGNDLDLIQHVSPVLIQPSLSCDIYRGEREGKAKLSKH